MAHRAATKKKKPALNIGGTSNRLRGGVAGGTKGGRKEGRQCVQIPFFLSERSAAAAAAAAATAWISDSNSLSLSIQTQPVPEGDFRTSASDMGCLTDSLVLNFYFLD